jgi:serine/threonine protein kinase/tetratricopeptide (TPR) repeat protein
MPGEFQRVKDIFLAAAEQIGPRAREEYLCEACGGDAALRRRVEALLHRHEQAAGFLDAPALPAAPRSDPGDVSAEAAGTRVGPYTLLEQIGEGGMGTVWMAEQQEPVRRKVALKVIKPGMDSRQVIARFEVERQALALMDHPNIAKVHDAGSTEAGRPYFVMELVQGTLITRCCDEQRLTLRQRLELFVPVCQALQHAHQKGVIHRDVKPSNVLVAPYDGKPVAKVIDFGIAKAVGEPLTERTLYTGFGAVVGTLEYMSPEQAELNNQDIDTRSDVYSLGVLLYELLTGTTPLARPGLKQTPLPELLRLIREEEPPKPSTRLCETTESLPTISARRQTEPARLRQQVRGELDWIVMKALEKDRDRRYESAGSLARDVERYLAGEPVLAVPPSAGYRLRKFVRRHRPQVVAAGLALAALLAGLVGTSVGLAEARVQERRAREERDAKEAALQAEAAQRSVAEARLAKLDKGVEILGSVFANLDPKAEVKGGDALGVALGKQLDRAADELKGDAIGDPLVVARLQAILAKSLYGLGRYARAVEVLEPAIATRAALLGDDHPDTLALRIGLADLFVETGQARKAVELFERSVPTLIRVWGADDLRSLKVRTHYANTLVADNRLGDATNELVAVVAAYEVKGASDDRHGLIARNSLAHAYLTAGKFAQAVPLLERTLPTAEEGLGIDHPDTLVIRSNLAMGYEMAGQYAQSIPLLQRTAEALAAKLGDDHPNTLRARTNLAVARRNAGQLQGAVADFERLLVLQEAKGGPNHPSALMVGNQLGISYLAAGKPDRAIPLLERILAAWRSVQGEDGPNVVVVRGNLARAYGEAGQPARAVPLLEANLALDEKRPVPNPINLALERNNLGNFLRDTGQFERAVRTLETALAEAEAKLGVDHPTTLICRGSLSVSYLAGGQRAKAIPLLKSNLGHAMIRLGEDHPDTIIFRVNLASALRDEGAVAEALPAYETAIEQARRVFGPTHPKTLQFVQAWADALEQARDWDRAVNERQGVVAVERQRGKAGAGLGAALARLGRTLVAAGRPAEAEVPLREALAVQTQAEPELWTTFNTQSLLGGALLGQKKYADAEPLLLQGYEGMKQREAMIPVNSKVRRTEALERLVQLYDATGRPDQAAAYRHQLEDAKKRTP